MAFPMTFPRELGGEKDAVAVGSQACAATLSIRHRRLRGPAMEHCQLREFRVEIDDARRSAFHFSLRLAIYRPGVVDIELDMLAGEGRRVHLRRALRRMTAVPCTLRNDDQHSGAKSERLGRPVVAYDFQRSEE